MSEERKPRKHLSSNDVELVVVTGRSVHTPGEKAKPRPAHRPRPRVDLDDAHQIIVVDIDPSKDDHPANDI